MNSIIKKEAANIVHGVEARAFGVVAADNGRILNQKIAATRYYQENGSKYRITATMQFDDAFNNGHETFSITADIRKNGREYMGGCCHDEIASHFPEWAHLIKWHLCSTDGPMHYVANTMYHADEHGPTRAFIYCSVPDPLGIADAKERCLICTSDKAQIAKAEATQGYRVEWNEETAKAANA